MSNEISSKWDYPVIDVSMDRRVSLPGVKEKYAGELAGVEGSLQGGLRPFAGFREIYELDFHSNHNHSTQSQVTDFFPVNFNVDFDTYAYGFVYRVKRPGAELADVFLDFYLAGCGEWSKGNLLYAGVNATEPMDVESTGRVVVVAISGSSPIVFFVTETVEGVINSYDNVYCLNVVPSTSSSESSEPSEPSEPTSTPTCLEGYYLIIEDNPGPGLKPTLKGPLSGMDELFKVEVPTDTQRPGAANLVLSSHLIDTGYYRSRSIPLYESQYTQYTLVARTDQEIATLVTEGIINLTAATATFVGTAALDDESGTSLILRNTDGSAVRFTTDPTLNFGDVTAKTGNVAATATIIGTADLDDEDGTDFILTNADGSTVTFHTDPTKNFGDTSSDDGDHRWIINTRDIEGGDEVRKATQAIHIACLAAIAAGELDMTAVPATNTGTQTSFVLTQTTTGDSGNTPITLVTGVTADGETAFTGGLHQWRVNTRDIEGGDEVRKATQALFIACKGAIDGGDLDMTIAPTTVDTIADGSQVDFTLTQTTAGVGGNTAITLITGVTASGATAFAGGTTTTEIEGVSGFSEDCLASDSSDNLFDCIDVTSADEVKYIGSWPGGKYHPDSSVKDASYCIHDVNTVPTGEVVNQLPILRFYFYINEDRPINNLVFDIRLKKKAPASTGEDETDFFWLVKGGSFVLDDGNENGIWKQTQGDAGGYYHEFKGTAGRNKRVVTRKVDSFADDLPGFTCYVAWINAEYLFECDYFNPGDYEAYAILRTICCGVSNETTTVSPIAKFTIEPIVCRWGIAEEGEQTGDRNRLERGTYTFAYMLFDSRTSRKAALSERISINEDDFSADENYAHMEIVYDKDKFDHAYVYRSVMNEDAGGPMVGAILQLDKVVKLRDYHIEGYETGNASYNRVIYPYKLKDGVLAMQNVYNEENTVFDERMPYGGALEWFNGTLLMSRIKNTPQGSGEEIREKDHLRGIGELRWSSMTDISAELFSPLNRYLPAVPASEISSMVSLGDMVFAFSKDRIFNIRKDSTMGLAYVRIQDLHEGYGAVGPSAVESVGADAFFLTAKGIKVVDIKGQLDDVRAFDHHVIEHWPADLSTVEAAFDSASSVLFFMHPGEEEAVCLWFNTSRSTLLKDMAFKSVKRGTWPQNPTNFDDDLVERALFLQNPPTGGQGFKPRVYLYDFRNEKTISGSGLGFDSQRRITMMDGFGDSRFAVAGIATDSDGNTEITLNNADGSKVSNSWVGSYLYVTECSDESMIGKKAKILRIQNEDIEELSSSSTSDGESDEGNAIITLEGNELSGSWTGRVHLSPVYFRWIGHPVGQKTKEGVPFSAREYHRTKQISSLQSTYGLLSGPPTTDGKKDDKYRGMVFEGENLTPADADFPRDLNGVLIKSMVEGEGVSSVGFGSSDTLLGKHGVIGPTVTPGVEVICSDLDFNLLSVIVEGKVLSSSRSSKPDVGAP